MNARILLVAALTAAWFAGSLWWYDGRLAPSADTAAPFAAEPLREPAPATAAVPAEPPAAAGVTETAPMRLPLSFAWNAAEVQADTAEMESWRQRLSRESDGRMLTIIGHYYPAETNASAFTDLGLARAAHLRDQLRGALPEERILIQSQPLASPLAPPTAPFAAADFHWSPNILPPPEAEVIPAAGPPAAAPTAIVYFATGESRGRYDEATLEALRTLVDVARSTGRPLLLAAHTDDRGPAELKDALALERAGQVLNRLRSLGYAERVEISVLADRQPAADNATAQGRRLNRRVDVRLAPRSLQEADS